jgi:GAF domain-containing protein
MGTSSGPMRVSALTEWVAADGNELMVEHDPLHALLDVYADLRRQVAAEASAAGALHAVTTVAARTVPGVDAASITRALASGSWETLHPTSDVAGHADEIQYQLGTGPCVDAVKDDHVFRSPDVETDSRWPSFGPLAAESAGVHSVLSIRLTLDDDQAMAGLNLYSLQRDAFDDHARDLAMLLATHAGVTVSGMLAREKAANLEIALTSSREIGVAMGVLMTRYKITREEAFDLMRMASQRSHRKLRDIAAEVAETGTLELP